MTLAQKLDRPLALIAVDHPSPPVARAPIDLRHLARRISAIPAPVAASPPSPSPRVKSDTALDLLGEVAAALAALMNRCQTLEEGIAATKEQARLDVEAAQDVAREWQEVATTLKGQITGADRALSSMRQRAEAAEHELALTQAVVDQSQKAAAEAECLTSLFQDKVIASFGIGSAGHSILESVRSRTEQMLTA